jgi:ABC-type multidrug transport system ATPase subunit
MRRKLLLVETLAPAPELLLLDEPSVGLDPSGTSALREALRRSAEEGAAVVVASNETRDLPLWGTRIAFLHEGMIIEDATVESLLARLGTGTRIEIGIEEDGATPSAEGETDLKLTTRLLELEGIEDARRIGRWVEVRSGVGGRALPPLLAVVIAAGLTIREVRVREPDLAGLFFTLTGERLIAVPAPDAQSAVAEP